jgi:gephyrin
VLVITGGLSVSNIDYNTIIERSLGGTIHFDRVFMKPDMSTTFATVPLKATETDAAAKDLQQEYTSKLIFSLPGTPSSALLTLNLFVLSSLHKLAGLGESSQAIVTKSCIAPQLGLPHVAVVLTHHFHLDPKRTEYHRAVVTGSRSDGRLYATSIGVDAIGQPNPRIGSLAKANALVVLRPGRGVGIKGEIVEALMMGPIHGSDTRIIC